MKVEVTMKDPDTLIDAIEDAERDMVETLMADKGLTLNGATAEAAELLQPVRDLADRFFSYGEYVTIILDSEQNTATVKPK